jgi:acylphosphatase
VCVRFVIAGHVQGVWFRAGAQRAARELGLTGYVRNLPDGRVEAVACGDLQPLDEFARWLDHGPPRARVDAVTRAPVPHAGPFADFAII